MQDEKVAQGRAEWLRGLLISERNARGWSLEQTARAIARESGQTLTKQSFHDWETGKTSPRVNQFEAWARVFGLRLEIDLVRPSADLVPVRLPPALAPIARDLTALAPEDVARVEDYVRRLKPTSG